MAMNPTVIRGGDVHILRAPVWSRGRGLVAGSCRSQNWIRQVGASVIGFWRDLPVGSTPERQSTYNAKVPGIRTKRPRGKASWTGFRHLLHVATRWLQFESASGR